jgi:predicted ferric reductase
MAADPKKPKRMRGIPLALLLAFYLGIAIIPLVIAYLSGVPRASFRDEVATGLALVVFAMVLLEFVLAGRSRWITRHIGIDVVIRLHQLFGWTIIIFVVLHPVLYSPGFRGERLSGWAFASGMLALLLIVALVLQAICRRQAENYEQWRIAHAASAVLIAVLGTHHAIEAGRYSETTALALYWGAMIGIAFFSLAHVHALTPLRQRRQEYRVVSVRPAALKVWELSLEPVKASSFSFAAGQFVWLTLDRSPFAVTEHPFSMSSAPGDLPRVTFLIKEAGDFTNKIGAMPVGARAYLDGPHGNFTAADREGKGLVFVAGGVGFAPILSILRDFAKRGERRPIRILYGNRCAEQIVARAELEDLMAKLDIEVTHVLSEPPPDWTGEVGQFDDAMLRRHIERPDKVEWLYFVCGPNPMMDQVERTLSAMGIPLRSIVSERFSYD